MSVNSVNLLGRLGKDPELRQTKSGTSVCNFTVATNRFVKTKDGGKSETDWHNVVVWGKRADVCAKYLAKGRQVFVEGRLCTRSYENKDGNMVYATEIIAKEVQFIDKAQDIGDVEQVEKPVTKKETIELDGLTFNLEASDEIPF